MKLVKFGNGKYGVRVFDWSSLSFSYLDKSGNYKWQAKENIMMWCMVNTEKQALEVANKHKTVDTLKIISSKTIKFDKKKNKYVIIN